MWQQEFTWFFALFPHEFRQGHRIAFEVLMALAFAHFFGFYNPKQLADFLDIPHQKLYAQIIYHPQSGWFEDTPLKGAYA